jgi:hypothetical protein
MDNGHNGKRQTITGILGAYNTSRTYRGYTITEQGQQTIIHQGDREVATLDKRFAIASAGQQYIDQVVEEIYRNLLGTAMNHVPAEMKTRIRFYLDTTRRK